MACKRFPLPSTLVANALSNLISRGLETKLFRFFLVEAENVPVSHLQYANDTVLFLGTNKNGLSNVKKKIIRCFEMVSGIKSTLIKVVKL